MEEINSRKRPLELDWKHILDQNDTEPLPLVIVKGDTELPKLFPMSIDHPSKDDCSWLSDRELEDAIERQKCNVRMLSSNLPDKGDKLRSRLKALQEEYHRRKLGRAEMDVDVYQLVKSGTTDGLKREKAISEVNSKSEFASIFNRTMEENKDRSIDRAFDKELSILGQCNHQKMISSGVLSERRRKKRQTSSSRPLPFQCATSLSHDGDKHVTSNDHLKDRAFSTSSSNYNRERLSSTLRKKKDDCQVLPPNGSRPRKGQTVVLVDEDETQLGETERANRVAECDSLVAFSMKDAKIYYPSGDDPESVEICYSDINCLAPKEFLTSEIMNFYIRYLWLQISPTNETICDYHFFNTFFYKKLKQAVSYEGSYKESFFVKFRRWWKGVNIFQKAYVFIPIHEDLHWSLVIICIPDEDESGPIILHLDSLGLHSSRSVFEEIKSFLREEWNYMKQEVSPSDLPIAEQIWKHLPRRIEEKKIEVPQQENDFDCGLFVLYFMEHFIEEAPERLKKKDLAMFGKRWFRPKEASGLRVKIRDLLENEFLKANYVNCISESPSSSPDGAPP